MSRFSNNRNIFNEDSDSVLTNITEQGDGSIILSNAELAPEYIIPTEPEDIASKSYVDSALGGPLNTMDTITQGTSFKKLSTSEYNTVVFDSTADTLTNKTITSNTNDIASNKLHSSTGLITINSNVPSAGQVLTSVDSTNATWQSPTNAFNFKGNWDATGNSPALASGVGTSGDLYYVSVSGTTTLDGLNDWVISDYVVFDGVASVWRKIDNTDKVISVNTQTGAVVLNTSHITENTNLYYTEARVNANTNVSSNTTHRGENTQTNDPHNLNTKISTKQVEYADGTLADPYPADLKFYNDFVQKSPLVYQGTGGVETDVGTVLNAGVLELLGGTAKSIKYFGDNISNLTQIQTIRMGVKFNFSGAPPSQVDLYEIDSTTVNKNLIRISISTGGSLKIRIKDQTNAWILIADYAFGTITSGVLYDIELNMDLNTPLIEAYKDGTRIGSATPSGFTRSTDVKHLFLGGLTYANHSYDYLHIYDTVQHTGVSYTPSAGEYAGTTLLPVKFSTNSGLIRVLDPTDGETIGIYLEEGGVATNRLNVTPAKTTIKNNLDMNTSNKIVNLANGSASTDATAYGQLTGHTSTSNIHFTEASIDHVNIANKGTNSHAQIDTHITNIQTTISGNTNVSANSAHTAIISEGNPHGTKTWNLSDVSSLIGDRASQTGEVLRWDFVKGLFVGDFLDVDYLNDTANYKRLTAAKDGEITTNTTHSGLTSGNPHSVTKADVGLTNVADTLNNFAGTVAPVATDDSGSGYSVGSVWVDTVADKSYVCVDSTVTAAVWKDLTSIGSGDFLADGSVPMNGTLDMNNQEVQDVIGIKFDNTVTSNKLQFYDDTVNFIRMGLTPGNDCVQILGNNAAHNFCVSMGGAERLRVGNASVDITDLLKVDTVAEKTGAAGITFNHEVKMGTRKITGLGNGSAAQDAVSKAQLDLMLPLTGGTISGNLTCNNSVLTNSITESLLDNGVTIEGMSMKDGKISSLSNGTAAGDAVNKGQLDTKLNLSGGTLSGNLTCNNSVLTNSIVEALLNNGVTIEGTSHKDGYIQHASGTVSDQTNINNGLRLHGLASTGIGSDTNSSMVFNVPTTRYFQWNMAGSQVMSIASDGRLNMANIPHISANWTQIYYTTSGVPKFTSTDGAVAFGQVPIGNQISTWHNFEGYVMDMGAYFLFSLEMDFTVDGTGTVTELSWNTDGVLNDSAFVGEIFLVDYAELNGSAIHPDVFLHQYAAGAQELESDSGAFPASSRNLFKWTRIFTRF